MGSNSLGSRARSLLTRVSGRRPDPSDQLAEEDEQGPDGRPVVAAERTLTPVKPLPPSPRSEFDRVAIFEDFLRPLRPGRLLDLATGHGKFALAAQRLGWQVTAVDARTERMPDDHGIEWVHADVRSYPLDGFDLITMFGILYHLELPDVLDMLKRAAGTLTIIDTHYAPRPTVIESGYEGYLFKELTSELTASVGNSQSFWPHPNALIRMLVDSGFKDVYVLTPSYHPNRTFYICN